jgi:hypothetical protein
MMTKVFPPFELQASGAALDLLDSGIAGFALERIARWVSAVWLQGTDGQIWLMMADTRDLQFKFEVFTLAFETIEGLQARLAAWTPPDIAGDVPEMLRQAFSTRPTVPAAPSRFDPWPFSRWRCDVLRRTEFIIEDVEFGVTLGDSPDFQSAGRPGFVPPEASAACEVAAGILFTGEQGERLLAAVDWRPTELIWTRDAAQIDQYLAETSAVTIDDYRRILAVRR